MIIKCWGNSDNEADIGAVFFDHFDSFVGADESFDDELVVLGVDGEDFGGFVGVGEDGIDEVLVDEGVFGEGVEVEVGVFFDLAQSEVVGPFSQQQNPVAAVVEQGHSRLNFLLFRVLGNCLKLSYYIKLPMH